MLSAMPARRPAKKKIIIERVAKRGQVWVVIGMAVAVGRGVVAVLDEGEGEFVDVGVGVGVEAVGIALEEVIEVDGEAAGGGRL